MKRVYFIMKVGVPLNPRQAGRPRVNRISSSKKVGDGVRKQVCSRCKKGRHNRASCKENMNSLTEEASCSIDGSKKRKAKHCSICHVVGHTRVTCPQK